MTKTRSKSTPRFDREICVACTSCVETCPAGALTLEVRNSIRGFRRYPELSTPENCIGCGLCEHSCPVGAVTLAAAQGMAA